MASPSTGDRAPRRRAAALLAALLLSTLAAAGVAGAQGVDEEARSQVVERVVTDRSLDREDVLLAMALSNGAGVDIDVEDLLEGEVAVERATVVRRDASLDEETVFSALVLDLDADDLLRDGDVDAADLDAIDGVTVDRDAFGDAVPVGEVEAALTERRVERRSIDLDREDVLLVIALQNAVGGDVDLEDVADVDRTIVVEQDLSRAVDIDADDAFLALALDRG